MAALNFEGFLGALPSINPKAISPRNATEARNCVIEGGEIRPLRAPVLLAPSPIVDPTTLFRYKPDTWLVWDRHVDVVRSVVSNDQFERIYMTGAETYPTVSDNTLITGSTDAPASHRLGVPAPSTAPGATVIGTAGGTPLTRFYVYTYVDGYGGEGPPSPPSSEVVVETGQTVDLTMTAPPGAPYNIAKIRIYRTNTAGSTAVYQFVDEVSATTLSYNDAVLDADLKEALISTAWDEPPADLQGLTQLPGGILAGFRENEVLFSEPGQPQAWPVAYRLATAYKIVGLAYAGTTLFALTEGMPYAITGTHPQAMTATMIRTGLPCTGREGIAVVRGVVLYATPDGIAAIDAGRVTMVSEAAYTRKYWRENIPRGVSLYRWNDLCLALYGGSAGQRHVMAFDPAAPEAGVVDYDDTSVSTVYYDETSSTLYIAAGGSIAEWDVGEPLVQRWASKTVEMPAPAPLGVAQIIAKEYPVAVEVTRDGELQDRLLIGDAQPVRLAGGQLGLEYSVAVESKGAIRRAVLASTMAELKEV